MNKVSPRRLGDLITLKRGYDLPENDRVSGPYPVISSAGVSGFHNEYKVDGQGVLTGRYGTLGEMYFVDGKYWPHNTALYVQNFKSNDPKYIYYLLSCLGRIRTSDKSAVPGVNRNELHEMAIPAIDDKKLQIAIRKVLEAIDQKIELNNRINAELEAMAKTLYDYWFVQFDFPDITGKPYKISGGKMNYNQFLKRAIPEGWEARPLSKITAVSNQSVNPADHPDQIFRHYSIPVYDSTGTYGLEAGNTIGSSKFTVKKNDILVSKLNPWFSRVVHAKEEANIICSTEFVVWRAPNSSIKNFLYMVATSPQFIAHCTQSATGTSNSHKRVNPGVMMRFEAPFKEEIASALGDKLEPMIRKMIINQRENTELAKLRDWLLPMLMNGQVTIISATQPTMKVPSHG